MLVPKKMKYRKPHRGKRRGNAKGGTEIEFGEFGLQAQDRGWITNRQIEAARIAMTRKIPHQVIIRPVISEKSYTLIETEGQYTFQVDKRANKNQIKAAIESAFDVSVYKVNTSNVKSKPKRQGLTRGRTATWKKAVVRLAEGDTIELFEGV